MNKPIDNYVVFDSPEDYPGLFVVRRFVVTQGKIDPDEDPYMLGSDYYLIEREMAIKGLFRIPRSQEDPPSLMETWV